MVLASQDWSLAAAGVLGASVAVVHGVLTQRLMVRPVAALTSERLAPAIRRLVPALLHFSTYNWLLGGLALVVVAVAPVDPQARLAVGLLVASSYLFGVIGNFWGTRGRHPGWALYAISLGFITYGLWEIPA